MTAPKVRRTGKWSKPLKHRFCELIAEGASPTKAAEVLGLSRQSAYYQRGVDEDFAAFWEEALEQAAVALGGRLVYAVVPNRPLSETLEDQALSVAARMTGSVRHTMRLEDQEPSSDLDQRTRDLAQELLASPARLWSMPNGG